MIQAIKNNKISIYTGLGLLVLAVLALIPCMPITGLLNRDSGIFLYIAKQILAGEIPYRDIWDHKGPTIYYIDALGLLLAQGSRWGVWFIELLSLYSATWFGYIVMSRTYGHLPAIMSTITWLASLPFLLGSGNYTEEYSLPLSFAALFLFWYSESKQERKWYDFLIGVTLAISFLLRPNNIGVQTSIIAFYLLQGLFGKTLRKNLLKIIMIALGALSVILLTVIYFALNNSLYEALDTVFVYNYVYSKASLTSKFNTLSTGINLLPGVFLISFSSWLLGLFYAKFRSAMAGNPNLLYLLLIGFPFEILMSSVSGRKLTHYYINWLPIAAMLIAFLCFVVLNHYWFRDQKRKKTKRTVVVWLLALFSMMYAYSIKYMLLRVQNELREKDAEMFAPVTEYILNHISQEDELLLWGAEAKFYFLTNRKSPSRFVYQYPLYTRDYHSEEMVKVFLSDIITKKPIIIDSSPTNNKVPPIDDEEREKWDYDDKYGHWGLLAEMDQVFEFIHQHYKIVDRIGPEQWPVYVYVENEEQSSP